MNKYRMYAFGGSMLGAIACSVSLQIPLGLDWMDPFKFDGTTIPALLAIVLEVVVIVLIFFSFNSDSFDMGATPSVFTRSNSELLKMAFIFNVFNFMAVFCVYIFFSQIIPISVIQYQVCSLCIYIYILLLLLLLLLLPDTISLQPESGSRLLPLTKNISFFQIVNSLGELWKAYLPTIIGALASFIFLKPIVTRFKIKDRLIVIYAPIVIALGGVGLLDFGAETPPAMFYYLGGSLLFLGQGIHSTGNTLFLSFEISCVLRS